MEQNGDNEKSNKPTADNNQTADIKPNTVDNIKRLNYIGSKYQLLEWLDKSIKERTGYKSFENKLVGDLFGGTGVVSYHFRKNNASVISNDAELYSSIITASFTTSTYTDKCKNALETLQREIDENKYANASAGFVTKNYSPYDTCKRMFFTVENAKRIDYTRQRIDEMKEYMSDDEYKFILASLIISADAVSNVPAVYGCYLKKFKAKALKNIELKPIHTNTKPAMNGSKTYNSNVLSSEFISSLTECDIVYLDPPYNERQYSKNYFPLNIIAKTPKELLAKDVLKEGVTGIPNDCFMSSFCKKGEVEKAFEMLFRELKTKWVILSYNSESLVGKEKMLEIMNKYGKASVIERDYKRFKSFDYNKDVNIKEYLFCLEKNRE
jgi:adenine-specific DNA-methyltransferase